MPIIERPIDKWTKPERLKAKLYKLTDQHVVLEVLVDGRKVRARFHRTSRMGFGAWSAWRLSWRDWNRWWVDGPERECRDIDYGLR